MSDHAPPSVAGNAVVGPAQEGLTPDRVEAVLADFRSWLQQAAPPAVPPAAAQPLDLHTLLSQFVALRHEVNLQTRASRAQQEQNSEALKGLGEALDLLRQQQEAHPGNDGEDRDEQLRPLLKTLIDLHDSLSLAGREVQRVQEALDATLETLDTVAIEEEPEPEPPLPTLALAPSSPRSSWGRLFGGRPAPQPAGLPAEAMQPWRERLARQQEQIE